MKPVFNYFSEQVHEEIGPKGRGLRKIRRVTVKNGKGTKELLVKDLAGKTRAKSSKRMTKKEVAAIKRGEYLPALFKSCALKWNSI
jgi:hypothetical protein